MIKYLIAFMLFSSPCLAGMGIGGFPYPGPGVVGADVVDEYTLIVEQTINQSTVDLSLYVVGTTFILPTSATSIRFTFQLGGTPGSCAVRVDDDQAMSSEYIAEQTFTGTSGQNKVVVSSTFTSGTRFSALSCAGGTISRADTDVDANIGYKFGTAGTWELASSSARDLTIKIEYK